MNFLKDFKEFTAKGNMMDMAIGIVIGTAFGAIVNSLVKDILMPILGIMTGRIDFNDKQYVLKQAILDAQGQIVTEAIAIRYGSFIQLCIDFIIIAFAIFVAIRFINRFKRKAEEPTNTEVPTPKDIELLTEIRDLLKGDRK